MDNMCDGVVAVLSMVDLVLCIFFNAPCWERCRASYFAVGMVAGVHTGGNRPSRASPARTRRGKRKSGASYVQIIQL